MNGNNNMEEKHSKELCFFITEEWENERIDKALSDLIDSLSRSFIQKLIKDNAVTVDGVPVKGSYRVKADEIVEFELPESVEPDIEPENIPLEILYEDKDVIIVNKPKGMVVHPAAGHYSGTLVNALMYHCGGELSGINGVLRPGIVHRIDMDTTGSVIACKNNTAHAVIAEQLKEHTVTRRYVAVCYGCLKEDEGSIGHPLFGDEVYSNRKCPFHLQGQTLHAKVLGFIHPSTGEYVEVEAPLPEYFSRLLSIL